MDDPRLEAAERGANGTLPRTEEQAVCRLALEQVKLLEAAERYHHKHKAIIKEQAAEIERLKASLAEEVEDAIGLGDYVVQLKTRAEKAAARISALQKALEDLLRWQNGPPLARYDPPYVPEGTGWTAAVKAAEDLLTIKEPFTLTEDEDG